ncbi:hypothetical protein BG004_004597 [Podila humilis]|nr:hypothetical protein BG004_004597 [Podila humilis]
MFLAQDALALLYTLTRISVSWLLSLVLCIIVHRRLSQDVIYLSQQSVPNLVLNSRSWFARNTGGARTLIIIFMFLSIPVTLLPTILTRFHGVILEPGLDPTTHYLQEYTSNNLTFDRASNRLSINPQIGSNKIITTNVQWAPIDLNTVMTFKNRPWQLVYAIGRDHFEDLQYNTTFINSTNVLLVNGTYTEADDKLNLQSFELMKSMVATYFAPVPSGHNTTSYNPNIDIMPHTPTGLTAPNSLIVWAALLNQNGVAILETGIVGYRSMRAGRIGYNCSVAETMFLEDDPSLCFDNWDEGNPTVSGGGLYINRTRSVQINGCILTEAIRGMWHQMTAKTVKSYYRLDVDPKLWREQTVLLGKTVLSDTSATAIYGSGQKARPPIDFVVENTPVVVDDALVAHLLYLVGSKDVTMVGSYGIGRTFSTLALVVWGVVTILFPLVTYAIVTLYFKDLSLAMSHCWDAVISSATHGKMSFEGKPMDVRVCPTLDGKRASGLTINHSALRAVDEYGGDTPPREDRQDSDLVYLNRTHHHHP